MSPELLVIMAKYPTPGRVKTRLARDIGARAAADLYRKFLRHFAREFADVPWDVEWRYWPPQANFRRLVGNHGYRVKPQPRGGLGQRMRRIFTESFARGYRRVVMIGTDAPEVGQRAVRRAFRALHRQSAVFQPTLDGGYALVGLAEMQDIFARISWSTRRVMAQTRRRLRARRISFVELPPTFDVDTAADLALLRTGSLEEIGLKCS